MFFLVTIFPSPLADRILSIGPCLLGGHRLLAHRGDYHASGVAILIHSKHTQNIKHIIYISDRVMAVDIQMGCKMIRVIAVYFPHTGFLWEDFENIMNQVSQLIDGVRTEGAGV